MSANTTQSPKIATDRNNLKVGNIAKETQRPLHHSIDRKHTFLYVKFEVGLIILCKRKYMSNKSGTFS
jgi:hypothetical protein